MTLYQRINQMKKYGNSDFKKNQIKAQKELEDLIYDFFVYAMDNNLRFEIREENQIVDHRQYMELMIPYAKTTLDLTVDSGRLCMTSEGIMSDDIPYMSLYTSNFGGYALDGEIARASMNNIHSRILGNDELNAYLLLQGLSIRKLFMIDRPYGKMDDPKPISNKVGVIFIG